MVRDSWNIRVHSATRGRLMTVLRGKSMNEKINRLIDVFESLNSIPSSVAKEEPVRVSTERNENTQVWDYRGGV